MGSFILTFKEKRMLLLSLFLSIFSFTFGCQPVLDAIDSYKKCDCGIANTRRIVGGSLTQKYEYPWQALIYSLRFKNGIKVRSLCGGSIITKKHILTADHCVVGAVKEDIEVYLGVHDRSKLEEDDMRPISKITRHISQLNETATDLHLPDVAILTLEEKIISFDNSIRPICFPSDMDKLFDERYAIVTGWGRTNYYPLVEGSSSKYLKKADVMVTNLTSCAEYWNNINDYNICTDRRPYQYEGKEAACRGDSGGPLAITENTRLTLVGVVSYGRAEIGCNVNIPEVYTRVTHPVVIRFIKGVIKADEDQVTAWDDMCEEI